MIEGMTALAIILAMLGHHADEFTDEIGGAIEMVCKDDSECVLDAIATCWVETRCRGRGTCGVNGCGPFQQVRRYTDHPRLEGLTYKAKTEILGNNALVATEQWLIKRNSRKARWGDEWPIHYNGSSFRHEYFERWKRARNWALSIVKNQEK